MQGAELVFIGYHHAAEVPLHELGEVADGTVQVSEDHSTGGQARIKFSLLHSTIDKSQAAYAGYFCQEQKEIALATREESVFFHELAHAAHQRISGELKGGQEWKQEIVAELSAASLCKIVGKTSKFLGNQYQYIEQYAREANLTPWQACMKVLSDVEKVLNLILGRTTSKDRDNGNGRGTPAYADEIPNLGLSQEVY